MGKKMEGVSDIIFRLEVVRRELKFYRIKVIDLFFQKDQGFNIFVCEIVTDYPKTLILGQSFV